MLKKPLAFLKKDFLMETSYKLSFLFNIIGITVSVLSYYFIDKLFGYKMVAHLQEFGVNYFSYVLLSMAFFSYVGVGLGSFTQRIYSEQAMGTLEPILLSPTPIATILLSLFLWNFIWATLNMIVYVLAAIFLFKISFAKINIFSTLTVLCLTITSFGSLGIISASFTMAFKRGNPLEWFINQVEGIISGIYFPITVLPGWLQLIAKFFPITYAVRAIQLSVYQGYSLAKLGREIGYLSLFSVILLPLSYLFFKYSFKKARKDGSLGQY